MGGISVKHWQCEIEVLLLCLDRQKVKATKEWQKTNDRHYFQGREIRIVKGSQSNYLKRQWMKSNG